MKRNGLIDEGESQAPDILPVRRAKREARRFYDRISKYYDYLTGGFERKYARKALKLLSIEKSETVLEIGFGTGHCLKQIAEIVNQTGETYGLDISFGMSKVTKNRLNKAGQADKVELCCSDAGNLPYREGTFDAVFMSFTLELFDTPEIPEILNEIRRILKSRGRLGVVSISKENKQSILLRLYEWAHKKWPKYVDCRPIYLEQSLRDAGYEIGSKEKDGLLGLPLEIVVALNVSEGT